MRLRACATLVVLVIATSAFAQMDTERLIPIAGAPLPPLPRDAVRAAIAGYKPLLAFVRLTGEEVALARGYGYLATLHAAIGETAEAERLFDQAQTLLEQNGSPAHDLGWVHNNRGLVELQRRRYAEAASSFRKSLALLKADPPELFEYRVVALHNLASAYVLLGDAEDAESAFLEALDLLRRLHKEGSHRDQVARSGLATLYLTMGDAEAARTIFEKLLAQPRLDRDLRFVALDGLAHALAERNDFAGAEARLTEARALTKDDSERSAQILTSLAMTYSLASDYERAANASAEALLLAERKSGPDSRAAVAAKANLASAAFARGEFLKAERLFVEVRDVLAKQRGAEEVLARVTRALAMIAQRRGQHERALALSRDGLALAKTNLERILAFGTEEQRLAYLRDAAPFDQLCDQGDARLLADAVLTTKGVVLETLLAERALARKSSAAADRERLDRINALKVGIMEKAGNGEPFEELARLLKNEQTALAKSSGIRARNPLTDARVSSVQSRLRNDDVLVEIVRYREYRVGGKLVPAYGAIVIAPRQEPVWVRLGEAQTLDSAIDDLVSRFGGGGRGMADPDAPADVETLLRLLHDRLWQPLANAFPQGTRHVLLSPDGATAFLPWTALLDSESRFIAERWQVTQIGSGRDLLRTAAAPRSKTLVAFADGGGDLPNSRREVNAVAAAAREQQWTTTVFSGDAAREDELLRHAAPRILHLATHGDQLRGDASGGAIKARLSRTPMYRGYILLSGGKTTLQSWERRAAIPFAADGILTAEEASALDLGGTWLTVLSACKTGVGEARAAEGVLGLRRGFSLAGAENLLMSLWSVDDQATADFMTAFYGRLLRGGELAASFHETEVEQLRRWKPLGISDAVRRAAGFVLMQYAAATNVDSSR
ncbi:MAG: CHAT domain-containing protein [Acidobacteriota bacterium]|nr:CHAT domain-containing protein [Acidobacteriota bacterium]